MNPTIIEIGYIYENLHYGPFASFWWYEKLDPTTKTKKLFPLRIKLNTQHTVKGARLICFIDINEKNQPEFICSIEQFISSANNMTESSSALSTNYNYRKSK